MAGDVNLFLLEEDGDEDDSDRSETTDALSASKDRLEDSSVTDSTVTDTSRIRAVRSRPSQRTAELMVMTADPRSRRKGIGMEAAQLMMRYASQSLNVRTFVVKISSSNTASLAMFRRLGFGNEKAIDAFEEIHLFYDVSKAIDTGSLFAVKSIKPWFSVCVGRTLPCFFVWWRLLWYS